MVDLRKMQHFGAIEVLKCLEMLAHDIITNAEAEPLDILDMYILHAKKEEREKEKAAKAERLIEKKQAINRMEVGDERN